MEVLEKPMLHYLVERLKQVSLLDDIVLATTINKSDDCLVKFADNEGIQSYRGSENNVLTRVIGAAESVKTDLVVEITGDCPIIDPAIIEQTIQVHINNDADYTSNAHIRSYPDGMDTQVFSLNVLKRSLKMTREALDREHVTLYIRNHPEIFTHTNLIAPPDLYWPKLGLTLDEASDFELLKKIIEHFNSKNPLFSCYDVVNFLKKNPELVLINESVVRKES
jgi:spore coat polysaccharide biosynthesis protein SpsF